MADIKFLDSAADDKIKYAVIISQYKGKWVFCKHRERNTLEIPGGHREAEESVIEAAKRELREETGAIEFDIKPVCVYSIDDYGMLYYADLFRIEEELHSEIEKIYLLEDLPNNWTYPQFHPKMIEEYIKRCIAEKKS